MSIKVNIHKTHRQFINDLDIVGAEGNIVGNCLDNLVRQFPVIGEALFDKKGKFARVIEIYVNSKSAYPDEPAKQVKDGDNIHITLVLAGG